MSQRAIIARIDHEGYDCVECQQWHDSGAATLPRNPNYDAHLHRQSKHGMKRWMETQCYIIDADGTHRRAPACEMLMAGEY